MSILQMSLNLSSANSILGPTKLFLTPCSHPFSLAKPTTPTFIRMGGGPRTFPGGVNKWQWKRMQAKKSKQLLRARLARERQIYEMRKRAELKAAVSELERPWEAVEKAPTLFSTRADEQVKVLADRFQKPGGFDLWSDKDGPQLFDKVNGVSSARFFPKGVVHSVKPYGRPGQGNLDRGPDSNRGLQDGDGYRKNGYKRNGQMRVGDNLQGNDELRNFGSVRLGENSNGYRRIGGELDGNDELGILDLGWDLEDGGVDGRNGYENIWEGSLDRDDNGLLEVGSGYKNASGGKTGEKRNEYSKNSRKVRGGYLSDVDDKAAVNIKKGNRRRLKSGDSVGERFNREGSRRNQAVRRRGGQSNRDRGAREVNRTKSEVFDMSLQHDGSYGISVKESENLKSGNAE